MKRFMSALLCVSLCLLVSSCGTPSNNSSSNSSNGKNGTIDATNFMYGASLGEYDYADFRSAKWHMTQDEVKATESTEPSSRSDSAFMSYDGITFGGLDCSAIYSFYENRLISGIIHFNVQHLSDEEYIADYNAVCAALTKQYGDSVFSQEYDLSHADNKLDFYSDSYKGYVTRWVVGHNLISLTLSLEPTDEILKSIYLVETDVHGKLSIDYSPFFTIIASDKNPFVSDDQSDANTDKSTNTTPAPTQQEAIPSPSSTPDLKQMAEDAVSSIKASEEENLTESELKIYREVWDALDAEPNRPEEEIFEEMAPNYSMTGEELKDFIMKAMEKVYG